MKGRYFLNLTLNGTDSIKVPAGTTAQRNGSPAAGMLRYNTTTGEFEGYSNSWGAIGGGSGSFSTNIFAGDGSDTTFTLSAAPSNENNLLVFVDGVFQAHDVYSVSGTTLTFATAPANGRVITVYNAEEVSIGTPSDNSVSTVKLQDDAVTSAKLDTNIDIAGTLDVTSAATFDSTVNGLTFAAGNIETNTSNNLSINTPNSLRINIDSNNSATDQVFIIGHNQTAVDTSNALMSVLESGHVGIGMTPAPVGSDTVLSIFNSATPRIKLHNSTTGSTSSDGGEINMSSSDLIIENREAGNQRFFTNGSERLRIQSGGGISFNADTAAANALDDYEEGTWTPTFGGATLTTATGNYTKIGNQVTVHYTIETTGGMPTSTSQVQIGGLPFAQNSVNLSAGAVYCRFYVPNDSALTSIVQDGESVIRFININDQNFDYTTYGELEASHNNSVKAIGTVTYIV